MSSLTISITEIALEALAVAAGYSKRIFGAPGLRSASERPRCSRRAPASSSGS